MRRHYGFFNRILYIIVDEIVGPGHEEMERRLDEYSKTAERKGNKSFVVRGIPRNVINGLTKCSRKYFDERNRDDK